MASALQIAVGIILVPVLLYAAYLAFMGALSVLAGIGWTAEKIGAKLWPHRFPRPSFMSESKDAKN